MRIDFHGQGRFLRGFLRSQNKLPGDPEALAQVRRTFSDFSDKSRLAPKQGGGKAAGASICRRDTSAGSGTDNDRPAT